jgi:hypothetical protein
LQTEPRSVDARIGHGYALAYQRQFEKAAIDFREVLREDADNLGALSGLGYVLAWSGAYDESEETFRRVLALAPEQSDAAKGLAWVRLWRGDLPEATRRFEAMARKAPDSAEAQVGLGQSLLGAGKRSEARAAFARALEIEPGRPDARIGLENSRAPGWLVQAIALGGLTDLGDSSRAGLRFAEIGLSPGERTRFWFQYDDSLSLDAPGLARQGLRVPTYWAGGLLRWGERYTTQLEGGWRKFTGGGVEGLARAEQIISTGGTALKAGGWVGPRPDGLVEAGAHFTVQVPLGDSLQLEPGVFYGRSGVAGEHDIRGLIAAAYRLRSGIELGAGIAAGRAMSPTPAFDGAAGSVYARASLPLTRALRTELLVKHDRPQFGPSTTAYVLGLAVAFGGQP